MAHRQQRKPTLTTRPVSQVTESARPESSYKAQQEADRFDSPVGASADPYAQLGALADYQVDQPRPRGFSRSGDEDLLS